MNGGTLVWMVECVYGWWYVDVCGVDGWYMWMWMLMMGCGWLDVNVDGGM